MNSSCLSVNDRLKRLFEALQCFEKEQRTFSLAELVQVSGYKESSLRTYLAKKLKNRIVFSLGRGEFRVNGVLQMTLNEFICAMSQKGDFPETLPKGMVARLLDRSLGAFLLALEMYNRPTQPHRIEAFCIMAVNAWELLLKAELMIKEGETAIYYTNANSRTISIRDALKRLIQRDNDPMRMNIEYMIELRDQAIHLLIPELQPEVSRLFQANVFNYIHRYRLITGSQVHNVFGTGLISLVIDPHQVSSSVIKKSYSEITAQRVEEFLERFRKTEKELSDHAFAIPIDYKLVYTRREDQGDIALRFDSTGVPFVEVTVPKDIDRTHPHLQKDVVARVNERLSDYAFRRFTTYDFQAILYREKEIRSSKSNIFHHFIEKPPTHRYSDKCIDFIVDKIIGDPNYLNKCRESYRNHLRKKRSAK